MTLPINYVDGNKISLTCLIHCIAKTVLIRYEQNVINYRYCS